MINMLLTTALLTIATLPGQTADASPQIVEDTPPDASTTQPATAPAPVPEEPSLPAAHKATLTGHFDEAVRMYDVLAKDAKTRVEAACGRAWIDLLTGEYTEGINRLLAVEDKGRRSADWLTKLGMLYEEIGEYDKAMTAWRDALKLNEEHNAARWALGSLLEELGRIDEAVAIFEPFETIMLEGPLPDDAENLTCLGQGFYRRTVLTNISGQRLVDRTQHVLREIYQESFEYVDELYWPARLAAAELVLEKHNLLDARDDFNKVLEINPNVADAHVGIGWITLADWKFEEAEKEAQAALAINPRCIPARVLLACIRMIEERFQEAEEIMQAALETNSNDLAALSVLAAAQLSQGKTTQYEATRDRVNSLNPRCALFHYTIGRWLAGGRQFQQAEKHLQKAVELAPGWSDPRMELGQVYMETGDKKSARRVLEEAHERDSFNIQTFNLLDLLDVLDGFAQYETAHFIIEYDETVDEAVVSYYAAELEDIYGDICELLETEPADKTIIELYPNHYDFSRRVGSRPFISTIGACTGRVIAMMCPQGLPPFYRFNWADVLRHEFAHTVTLGMTNNRISHWLTEGVAVHVQTPPRSFTWKQQLTNAHREDELFDLQSIDWGFKRPRRAGDRALAYAQSEWMLEYILERYQKKGMLDLLAAVRDSNTEADAFQKALHISPEDFFAAFKTWAAQDVEKWNIPEQSEQAEAEPEDPEELEKALAENPEDPDLLIRRARMECASDELDKAEETLAKALEIQPDHTPAIEAMAHFLITRMLRTGNPMERADLIDRAEPHLRKLLEIQPDNTLAWIYLGYVEQAHENWQEAINWYTQYLDQIPDDPDPHRRLAAIYERLNRPEDALAELQRLTELLDNDPFILKRIADFYERRGDQAKAAAAYRKAIDIDPYDITTHLALGDLELCRGYYMAAEREFNAAAELAPRDGEGPAGLSRVYRSMGNYVLAETYAQRALMLGAYPYAPPGGGLPFLPPPVKQPTAMQMRSKSAQQ